VADVAANGHSIVSTDGTRDPIVNKQRKERERVMDAVEYPGAEAAGSVSPSIFRPVLITPWPCHTILHKQTHRFKEKQKNKDLGKKGERE